MTQHQLNLDVNLSAAIGQLQRALQRSLDLTAFGLHAADQAAERDLNLPETFFHLSPAQNEALGFDAAKTEFRAWTVRNGLRDSIEAFSLYLDEVRTVCGIWSLGGDWASGGVATTVGEWQARMVTEARKFHEMGLPHKLDFLEKEYGLGRPPFVDEILTINAARNCLVHRRGIVRRKDLNTPEGLLVRWARLELIAESESGSRSLEPPKPIVKAGEKLSMRQAAGQKTFPLGHEVSFSTQEFAELSWTIFQAGRGAISILESYGRAKGITFDDAAQAESYSPKLEEPPAG